MPSQRPVLFFSASAVVHAGVLGLLLINVVPHLPDAAAAGDTPVTIAIATDGMMPVVTPDTSTAEQAPPPMEEVAEIEPTEAVLASNAADAPLVEDPLPTLAEEEAEAVEVAEVLPPPPPAPPQQQVRPPRQPRPRPVTQRAAPAAPQQATGTAQTAPATATAGPASNAGAAPPGPPPSYLGRLQAWLERHKGYPTQARQQRQQGTALLHFVMDRSGRVTSFNIVRSSGYQLLDSEVTNMIQRASPLPAMPAEMNLSQLELTVPVRFNLR